MKPSQLRVSHMSKRFAKTSRLIVRVFKNRYFRHKKYDLSYQGNSIAARVRLTIT